MALDPLAVLRLSVSKVPALKYALGVAGLLAVVAISKVFSLDPSLAVAGTVVTLLLMTSLVVFAKLSTTASRHFLLPVQVLMWAAMVLLVATGALLFTSAFFHWPTRFRSPEAEPIPRDAVSSEAAAPAAAAENVSATQSLVQSQLDAGDYATAWKTAKQASDTQPASPELLALSAKVAEAWIRNAQISDGETFAGLVDPFFPSCIGWVTVQMRHKPPMPSRTSAGQALTQIPGGHPWSAGNRPAVPKGAREGRGQSVLRPRDVGPLVTEQRRQPRGSSNSFHGGRRQRTGASRRAADAARCVAVGS